MSPEGDPTSMGMQEILFWQSNTMKRMYKRIGEALKKCEEAYGMHNVHKGIETNLHQRWH